MTQTSTGIGFVGLLTIVLVILKATGYLDWGWFWIFSPVLIGALCVVSFLVFMLVIAVIMTLIESRKGKYG